MIYRMKDIKKLGVTEKAIRCYEKANLINIKRTDGHETDANNICHNYREFSQADYERIWEIKLLQGIGYNYKEIKQLLDGEPNHITISEKIKELQQKANDLNCLIGYAQKIELTGRLPHYYDEELMKNPVTYTDTNLTKWNVKNSREDEFFYSMVKGVSEYAPIKEFLKGKNIENIDDLTDEESDYIFNYIENIGLILNQIEKYPSLIGLNGLEIELAQCSGIIEPNDKKPQKLCKLIHDLYNLEGDEEISKETLIFIHYNNYKKGLLKNFADIQFTKEQVSYILDALAIYNGFKNLTDYLNNKEE